MPSHFPLLCSCSLTTDSITQKHVLLEAIWRERTAAFPRLHLESRRCGKATTARCKICTGTRICTQRHKSASLCPGAPAAVLTAGSHSPGHEGRDHPEAAGPQLWSNREHQQLPQPVRAATHQCQVGRMIPCSPHSSIIKVIFSSPLGVLSPPPFFFLSTCCRAWIARELFSSSPLCLYSLHTPISFSSASFNSIQS